MFRHRQAKTPVSPPSGWGPCLIRSSLFLPSVLLSVLAFSVSPSSCGYLFVIKWEDWCMYTQGWYEIRMWQYM